MSHSLAIQFINVRSIRILCVRKNFIYTFMNSVEILFFQLNLIKERKSLTLFMNRSR